MNADTWLRRAPEHPPTPGVFVDKRRAANTVLIAGPPVHPCSGFLCRANTGSDAVAFCSEACQLCWHELRTVGT